MKLTKVIERENKRRKWQNQKKTLNEIGLKEGQAFADIGCRNGFFTIPTAKMGGMSQGKFMPSIKTPKKPQY